MRKTLLIAFLINCLVVNSQTIPPAQGLPYHQNFGNTSFNILPPGIAVWNGINGTTTNSQPLAEASIPTGNAVIAARSTPTTTGGSYGFSNASNGKLYIQSSSNSVEGLHQLVLSFNSGTASTVRISFDISVIEAGGGRSMGTVLQYRAGNAGPWTSVNNSGLIYNNASSNGNDVDANGDVDSYTYFLNGLANQTDYQLRIAHWRSGSTGSSVGIAYDNIHLLPLPDVYEITGGGSYCQGGQGLPVQLSSSQPGVWYQLQVNGNDIGDPVEGNGALLNLGIQSVPGTYTIQAYYPGGDRYTMNGQVFIESQLPPSMAFAGDDIVICDQTSTVLQASVPQLGIGSWEQLSGSVVNVNDALSSQTTISGLTPGTYIFRWLVEYGVCPASEDEVTITVLASPGVANAGEDIKVCGNYVQLNSNIPVAGTGAWTLVSGPGQVEFSDAAQHDQQVSVNVPGVYKFKWTLSNGICVPSEDEVEITFNSSPDIIGNNVQERTAYYGQSIDPVFISAFDIDDEASDLSLHASYSVNSSSVTQGLPPYLLLEHVNTTTAGKEWKIFSDNPNLLAAGIYTIYLHVKDACGGEKIQTVIISILRVNAEPLADAFYTGSCFFWTNQNSKTATLTLAATLRNSPGTFGDIRTAKVSFYKREGQDLIPIQGAQEIQVGLINNSDLSTGSASVNIQYNLGAANVEVLNIAVVVSGNYKNNDPATDKSVTVAVPIAGGQICGGVNLLNQNSQGLIAGALGQETNTCFYVQYNSSLKNIQGKLVLKILSNNDKFGNSDNELHTYLVRSNSISSLSIFSSSAEFTSKANLSEIINGIEYPVEGNCILQLKIADGELLNIADRLSVNLLRNKGGLWFSSSWNGNETVLQNILNGNLSVTNGMATNRLIINDHHAVTEKSIVFPNPSNAGFKIQIPSDNQGPVSVIIYDLTGRRVHHQENITIKNIDVGRELKTGVYLLKILRGLETDSVLVVKQ